MGIGKLSYQDYLDGTEQRVQQNRLDNKPYSVIVAGRKFTVYPNVFSPKYFHDTDIFAKHLPISAGETVLEIGPGTGAISITAIFLGAKKIVAIDINPDAVANTQANIDAHHLGDKIEVRQGDVYSALKDNEKFDAIFWNTPFGLVEEGKITDLEKSVYDPGYKSTERFIKEGANHLNPGGRLLIGFSSTLGKLDLIKKFCQEAGLNLKLVYEEESEEVHPVKFEIFEAK